VVLVLAPVMPVVGLRTGRCVVVEPLHAVRVRLALLPVMRASLPLFTPTASHVRLLPIKLEFEAKLCLILCKRRADPWTPMSFVARLCISVRLVLAGLSNGILSSMLMSGGPLFPLVRCPDLVLIIRSVLWT